MAEPRVTISCPACQSVFRVREERLPAGGGRTHCPKCAEPLSIPGPERPRNPSHSQASEGIRQRDLLFDLPIGILAPVEGDDVFGLNGSEAPDEEPGRVMPPQPTAVLGVPSGAPPPQAPARRRAEAAVPPPAPVADRRRGLVAWLNRVFGRR